MTAPLPAPLLSGRTAFITGGAQGIGLAVARAFVGHGARVTIADISDAALDAALAELRGLEGQGAPATRAVRLDVTDEAATEGAARAAEEAHGAIDVIVPNAGILVLKHAVDLSAAEWRRVIEVNLTGAFLTAGVFARRLLEQGRPGRLIFTSSLFGLRGGVENAAYSASKFGMIGLMQSMAAELAPRGILANCVCPGQIETQMLEDLFQERAVLQNASAASLREAFERRIPLRRLGRREEVADVFVYLASDLSRYVTGQSLTVDGGWQVG